MSDQELQVLDEHVEFTLEEVCVLCRVEHTFVTALVDEGVLRPRGAVVAEWRFSGVAVARTRRAAALHRDLGVNLPGVALALDLLGEIDRLRKNDPATR